MLPTTRELFERFVPRWRALFPPDEGWIPGRKRVFGLVLDRYAEPWRFYHTLDHVGSVLDLIDWLERLAVNPAAVRMAAWFHDVVYDPRAKDNEERSADFAAEALPKLAVPEETVAEVRRLILLTKTHATTADDRDGHILLDADLAVLGAAAEKYRQYAAAIRREYDWVPETEYRTGRAAVLRRFLERDRIYFTEPMYAEREAAARRNLLAEIAQLDPRA
jgi:predicted metal-dependent HD superfamily phosphohydrolase